jgi:hypothetical protein
VDLSIELAVEDFSGGEVAEELALSWFEIIELVITFFCCKNNYVLVRKAVLTEPLYNTVQDNTVFRIRIGSGSNWLSGSESVKKSTGTYIFHVDNYGTVRYRVPRNQNLWYKWTFNRIANSNPRSRC